MKAASRTDRVERIYDDLASVWDSRQGMVERVLMGEEMRRALAAELRGDVLEIGTGTGATYRFLPDATRLSSMIGVDLSKGMLEQAREAASSAGQCVRLAQMNAEALAFPDATFDTVTTSLTLCTIPDPARALREMARVCKPEGRIVLLEHVRAPNPILARLQKWLTPMQERHLGCHLDRPTDRLVRELGFPIEQEKTRFFGIFHLIVAQLPER